MMTTEEEFYVGQELEWLHGHHSHRIGFVLEVEEDRIKLCGVETEYWMSKKAMRAKLERPYPIGRQLW